MTETRTGTVDYHVDRMETLSEIGRVLASTLDLSALYEVIYQQVGRVMDTSNFFLALTRPDRGILEIPYLREGGKLYTDQRVPFGPNLISKVISEGTPVLFHSDADYLAYIRERGLPSGTIGEEIPEAMIFVPLSTRARRIGVLSVQTKIRNAYTGDDVRILSIIASQAAIAIENARLFAEEQERIDELSTIQSIVQTLSPLHDIPTIAHVIEQELTRLIDYHALRLFVVSDHTLVPLVSTGADISTMQVRIGEGIAGWIAAHGASVSVGNTLKDPRVTQIPGTPRREESMIGAPLIYEGRVQGVMTLTKLGIEQFDANDQRLLAIIAGQAAIVFDRARLYAELVKDAMTDPLTGLANRRYLQERLKEERSRAMRTGGGLAAIMLDIDRFKRVNDAFGHDAGDLVLRDVAGVIAGIVRVEDIVARFGGEEFCVVVPGIPPGDAEGVAERLRAAIAGQRLPEAAGGGAVTVSVGVAHLAPEDDQESFLKRADAAMYAGKHQGGNMVWVAAEGGFRQMASG